MIIRETIVLSLGGSIIVPDMINFVYLKRFRSVILRLTRRGYRFIIVAGGGNTARQYQHGARRTIKSVCTEDLDWIGIAATRLNAELVRAVFGRYAHKRILDNPTQRVPSVKRVLIGCGWKPGCSSDKDGVLLAKRYAAKLMINMSNIKYVYTADPRRFPSAKVIKKMSWEKLLDLTGRQWRPGAHVPFDPEASKLAQRIGLSVVICQGVDLSNLEAIITGKKYQGTVIS